MKYQVGDKVKLIRRINFARDVHKAMDKLDNDIATVFSIGNGDGYYMKEIHWIWYENEIDGIAKKERVKETKETKAELLTKIKFLRDLNAKIEAEKEPYKQEQLKLQKKLADSEKEIKDLKETIKLKDIEINKIYSRFEILDLGVNHVKYRME